MLNETVDEHFVRHSIHRLASWERSLAKYFRNNDETLQDPRPREESLLVKNDRLLQDSCDALSEDTAGKTNKQKMPCSHSRHASGPTFWLSLGQSSWFEVIIDMNSRVLDPLNVEDESELGDNVQKGPTNLMQTSH